MIKRNPVYGLAGIMLLIGLILGASFDSWRPETVQAKALERAESERLYRELNQRTGTLFNASEHLSKVARVATQSVVHIQSERRDGRGTVEETGSGVVMSHPQRPGLYVVTNRHVVNGSAMNDISLRLADGRELHPTQVWTDKATDIAVLKISVTNIEPAKWGDSSQVDIGHMVLAMGSPFGLSQSVTYGIISAKGRRALSLGKKSEVLNQDFLQTDAAINPGNSGGPLIDMQGRVVGINTAIASNSGGNEGIGFSIPSNLAQQVFNQLLSHGKVKRAYLGVKLDPKFDLPAANRLGLSRLLGARVVEVYTNTPASRAGLAFDDVILKINGRVVQDETDLINQISLTPVGTRVSLDVLRQRRQIRVSVLLGDREDLEQRGETTPAQPVPNSGNQFRNNQFQPMGLTTHTLDQTLCRQLGLQESHRGVLVMSLDETSPLFGKLHVGDVIESVAGEQIESLDDLQRTLELHSATPTLLFKIQRANRGKITTRLILCNRS